MLAYKVKKFSNWSLLCCISWSKQPWWKSEAGDWYRKEISLVHRYFCSHYFDYHYYTGGVKKKNIQKPMYNFNHFLHWWENKRFILTFLHCEMCIPFSSKLNIFTTGVLCVYMYIKKPAKTEKVLGKNVSLISCSFDKNKDFRAKILSILTHWHTLDTTNVYLWPMK